jgi:hypothetical protein
MVFATVSGKKTEKQMKAMWKSLQALACAAAMLATIQENFAQCSVRSVVKHTCQAHANGSIELRVEGAAPFQFQWSNGSQEQNLENLNEGTYSVTVTDAKGFRAVHSVRILKHQNLQVQASATGNRAVAQVAGGKAPYTYHWVSLSKPGKNTTSQEWVQLDKGSYLLIVEDGNGCSESYKFRIN